MDQPDRYEVLSRTFSNPTKFGIILLLAEHERMTATEMSKHLDVSRSNIYHFVAQLVEDGVLNEPEVVPRRNYVEKYYTLNEEMLESSDMNLWRQKIEVASLDEIRDLVSSALLGHSMNLKISAEQIKHASESDMKKLKKWLLEKRTWVTYATMRSSRTEAIDSRLSAVTEELVNVPPEKDEGSIPGGKLLLVFLPVLGTGSDSTE